VRKAKRRLAVFGVGCAEDAFSRLPDFKQSAINCETNAAISDMNRAIMEAADLMDWFNVSAELQDRLRARTASFCMERSGHYDAFDQGFRSSSPTCKFPCAAHASPQNPAHLTTHPRTWTLIKSGRGFNRQGTCTP
jgi:hypothetical protein